MGRIGVLALVGYAVLVVLAMLTFSPDLLLPAVQLPLLFWLTSAIARRISARTGDPTHFTLIVGAFQAKMLGTLLRMGVNELFYNGLTDARAYGQWGVRLAPAYRALDFSPPIGRIEGTVFMRLVTGIIYSFWGNSVLGASLLLSWLAFVGLLLLWLAFRRAVPLGSDRRYAYLVFFIPSMLYWPSALGKDAFAVFLIGAVSYGLARMMTGRIVSGLCIAGSCTYGVMLLRPHVALTVAVGVLLALAFGRSKGAAGRGNLLRMVGFSVLALATMVLISQTQTFFGVSSLDSESISKTLDNASERTGGEAGSSFTPVRMDNPATAIPAIVTVLYRPFPLEARNLVGVIASIEGVFLIVITFQSRRRFARLLSAMRESPYVAYSLGMTLAFIFAFSSFSNFGILARQRVQMLPLFFVLLCIPDGRGRAAIDPSIEEREDGNGVSPQPSRADLTDLQHQDQRQGGRFNYGEDLSPLKSDGYSKQAPSYAWSAGMVPAHELVVGNPHRTDLLIMSVAPLDESLRKFAWESDPSNYEWSSSPHPLEDRVAPSTRQQVVGEEGDERTSTDSDAEGPVVPPVPDVPIVEAPVQSDVLIGGEPYLHTVRVRYSDGNGCDLSEHTFRVESVLGEGARGQCASYETDATRAAAGVVSFALSGPETARLVSEGERIRVVLDADIEGTSQTLLVLDLAGEEDVQLTEPEGEVHGVGRDEIVAAQNVTLKTSREYRRDNGPVRFFLVPLVAEVAPDDGGAGPRAGDREVVSEAAPLTPVVPTEDVTEVVSEAAPLTPVVPTEDVTEVLDADNWFDSSTPTDDDLLPS